MLFLVALKGVTPPTCRPTRYLVPSTALQHLKDAPTLNSLFWLFQALCLHVYASKLLVQTCLAVSSHTCWDGMHCPFTQTLLQTQLKEAEKAYQQRFFRGGCRDAKQRVKEAGSLECLLEEKVSSTTKHREK
jgi:hypothetical protein